MRGRQGEGRKGERCSVKTGRGIQTAGAALLAKIPNDSVLASRAVGTAWQYVGVQGGLNDGGNDGGRPEYHHHRAAFSYLLVRRQTVANRDMIAEMLSWSNAAPVWRARV